MGCFDEGIGVVFVFEFWDMGFIVVVMLRLLNIMILFVGYQCIEMVVFDFFLKNSIEEVVKFVMVMYG